jgi:hypothetical protein
MNNQAGNVHKSPIVLQEAFERLRPELVTLHKKDLSPINVDPITAASIIRAALPRAHSLKATIQQELNSFDPSLLEKLDQYTLALIHAQRRCVCVKQPPEQLKTLIERLRSIREQFQFDITCLAARRLIENYRRATFRSSTSYRNLASDVLTLAGLFRKHWPAVSSRTAVTLEELNEAETLANDLISVLNVHSRSPDVVAQAALERQQVFTLCDVAYNQLRKAVTVVRWEQGDANQIAPSIRSGKRPRRKTKKASVEPALSPKAEEFAPSDPTRLPDNDPFINQPISSITREDLHTTSVN